MALESLEAFVVREEVEEDQVAHLVVDFMSVPVSVFFHSPRHLAESFPRLLQQLLSVAGVPVSC